MKQLVTIVNKVNNSAIRRIKNERGDLVYVVPSFTLPDNCVMNGGLYPADEIEKGYASLEGTPAPLGHPMDADGNYITANSPDGILYYQCGVFNKNVQRMQSDEYGHRVYVEKHIHVATAMQTDRGRRIIDAIDSNQPIHTSTGVILTRVNESGITPNGKSYKWKASDILLDHDAVLLDEDGAATPEDGVGMMINANLFKHIHRNGEQLTVNTATIDVNQSFNDLRETLQSEIQKRFSAGGEHVWLTDFGDDYAVFESGETAYIVSYSRDNEMITFEDAPQEVKRKTIWQRISTSVKSVLTSPITGLTSNKEGEDMAIKDMLKKRLGDKYEENMSEDDMMNAYDKMMKGNAAEETKTEGEQSQPEVKFNAADVKAMVDEAVQEALKANAQESEKAEKSKLAESIKANGVELADSDIESMSVNALKVLAANSQKPKPAYGLAGAAALETNSVSFDDTLPE